MYICISYRADPPAGIDCARGRQLLEMVSPVSMRRRKTSSSQRPDVAVSPRFVTVQETVTRPPVIAPGLTVTSEIARSTRPTTNDRVKVSPVPPPTPSPS